MAIVAVTETSKRSHGAALEKGARSYTREFWVETDDQATDLQAVREAVGVPKRGELYPGDFGSFCQGVTVEPREEDPRTFVVTADYDSNTSVTQEQEENPLLRPVELSFEGEQYVYVATKDLDGKAFKNSAGDPFDPPPEITGTRPVLVMQRNEAALNPTLVLQYQDAVNADAFLGFPPRTVKVGTISGRRSFENSVAYWVVSYRFVVDWRTWRVFLLDAGFREKHAGGHKKILDKETGQPVSAPVMLNGLGYVLVDVENPVYLERKVYREIPFAPLGLG